MKTIFKAAALAALALGTTTALPTAAFAQAAAAQTSIIVVDMDRVGADSAAGKSGQTQLKSKLDSLQARGKALADQLRSEEETLLKARQANTMAPEAFQAKVKELQTKQNSARTELGNRGINIISAAVGRQPEDRPGAGAVMIVTADSPVPREVVDGIVAGDGFHAGRTVSL